MRQAHYSVWIVINFYLVWLMLVVCGIFNIRFEQNRLERVGRQIFQPPIRTRLTSGSPNPANIPIRLNLLIVPAFEDRTADT